MNKFFKLILLPILFYEALFFTSSAQDQVNLLSMINKMGSVKVEYTITGKNSSDIQFIKQSGVVDIQGNNYTITTNGMSVFCNSVVRWIFSTKTEELVIVNNDMLSSSPIDNPLLFLSSSMVTKSESGKLLITYKADDGSVFFVEINKMEKMDEPWAEDHFVFDVEKCSDNVIITDLRNNSSTKIK
ncbi:MAG: hypothetical protein M0R23_04060 [Bacteroidales bacterium]|jgi:hypothetical protein|nr:hypothetical protein [Bacteroidales bacterium]